MLLKHVGKERVSPNLNIQPWPFNFPSVFTQNGTGECIRFPEWGEAGERKYRVFQVNRAAGTINEKNLKAIIRGRTYFC
jgi:hypothetical protein